MICARGVVDCFHRPLQTMLAFLPSMGGIWKYGLAYLALCACIPSVTVPPVRDAGDFANKDSIDELGLDALSRAAEQNPGDAGAQYRAGMAHVKATLVGHFSHQDLAERYLIRAYELGSGLEPETRISQARALGRFLNMRSSVLDTRRINLQVEVYESLQAPMTGESPRASEFHFFVFLASGKAMRAYDEGHPLRALARIRRLERVVHERTRTFPDEIDTFALGATLSSNFAGAIPVGRRRRLGVAASYFRVQQDRWQELSPGARDTEWAPNTRTVFMLARGDSLLAAGHEKEARQVYDELLSLPNEADTGVRRQLRAVARHRRNNSSVYLRDLGLLPLWPGGRASCVACHARETTLPTDDLYLFPGARVEILHP